MGKFDKKVVIVTGASSGIGAATAIAFAKEGANVTLSGRNKERLSDTAKKCKEAGAQVLEVIGDLAKFENLGPIITKTAEKFGAIDVLVNNAGCGNFGNIEDLSLETYEYIFQANTRAPVFLSKFALPHLKKTKGNVVNISSCASLKTHAGGVTYGMAKTALDHFTRGFSAECAPFGVRVNTINPGFVATRFADALDIPKEMKDVMTQSFLTGQPLGMINSDQVAEAILFLASASMITGVALPVDGGYLNH